MRTIAYAAIAIVVEPTNTVSAMNTVSIFCVAVGGVFSAFSLSRPAWAMGPIDVEVAARVGGASDPIKGDSLNALGFGAGARAGVSLSGIYAGVSAMYYLGGNNNLVPPTPSGAIGTLESESSWLYGVEGGYSFKIMLLTLRPTVQVGNYTIHTSFSSGTSQDTHSLFVESGLTALIGFGLWFVGADANVFFTPGLDESKAAFMGNVQGGVKF